MTREWQCTDPDSLQYCSKIDDYTWSYIETREWDTQTGEQVVCHTIIDIRDYTIDELQQYCLSYYNSLEQIVQDYGFRTAVQIMAECIFEQLSISEMEFAAKQNDFATAAKFIYEWLRQ